MRFKRVLPLICLISLLASVILAGISCSLGGSKSNAAAIAMMKKIPEGTGSFMYCDVEAFRSDDALKPALEDLLGDAEDIESWLGINVEDIEEIVWSGTGEEEDTGVLVLFAGDFELDDVRDTLEESGFEEDPYKSVEVWKTFGYGVALMADMIVFGAESDIKDCIDVIEDGDSSLYDKDDFRDIVDRLPDGIMLAVGEGSSVIDDAEQEYEGLEIAGMSASEVSSGKISLTGIFRFEDKEAASAAIDEVEANVEDEEGVTDVKVAQDGRYLKGSYRQDTSNLFAAEVLEEADEGF